MGDFVKPVGQTIPQATPSQQGQTEFPPWVEWTGYATGGLMVIAIALYRKYRQGAWKLYLKIVRAVADRIGRVCKNNVEPSARDNFYKDPKLTFLIKILYNKPIGQCLL